MNYVLTCLSSACLVIAILSYMVCLNYEFKIKKYLIAENIADKAWRFSTMFFESFYFLLSDCEHKIHDEGIKSNINSYRKWIRFALGFLLSSWIFYGVNMTFY